MPALQAGGQRFESARVHQPSPRLRLAQPQNFNNIYMEFFFGLIAVAIGVSVIWKTEGYLSFFGRVAWAGRNLGVEGGSRLFYKLLGLVIIFFGFMATTGLFDGFMQGLASVLTGGASRK